MILFPLSISWILLGLDLYQHRFDWEATTTFYYHWKWGIGTPYNELQMPYICNFAHPYNNYNSLEDYKLAMAIMYPDLIANAQFIYCSEVNDPNGIFAGRPPLFRKLTIRLPYFDRTYLLQHYYGYNKPFGGFNINADVVYTHDIHWWKMAFRYNNENIGKYVDYVHELHSTQASRHIVNDRPSKHMYDPNTIHKEPRGEYKIPLYGGLSLCSLLFCGFIKYVIFA